MGDAQPGIFLFLGDKTVALLAGAIVAYLIGVKCMGKEKAEKAATDSLSSAGIVFLITGAGGAFSNIITITGVSDAIADIVSGFAQNVFVVLILSYLCLLYTSPLPVVNKTICAPEMARLVAATKSFPGADRRFNPFSFTLSAYLNTSVTGAEPDFWVHPRDLSSSVEIPPFLLPGDGFS